MAKIKSSVKRKTKSKAISEIKEIDLFIHASFNNTIITASSHQTGDVIATSSSGQVGFSGTKKGTPYAATTAMKTLLEKIKPYNPELVYIKVSGAGNGRDAALRAIAGFGLKIANISDSTPLPHNGTRPKKARRV